MKTLTGRTIAATLIAGLLAMASVENHADELDRYLDNAMRTQVFQELKDNVQRLYESKWLAVPTKRDVGENVQTKRYGIPVANRGIGYPHPNRLGILN
jgi:hypothetical protein